MTFFSDPAWGPLLSLLVLSFVISLAITLVYRLTTNQRLMKQMRHDIKKYQEQMRATKDASKQLEIQKKMMDVNMKYMMQSMRPTLFTLVPVLIVFGWVAAHLTVTQIMPGDEFKVTITREQGDAASVVESFPDELTLVSKEVAGAEANYTLSGPAGRYTLVFTVDGQSVEKRVLITDRWDFERPEIRKVGFFDGLFSGALFGGEQLPQDSPFQSIQVHHEPVRPFGPLSIFGYMPGWLFTYILFSLVFSIAIRKVLDIQ